MALRLTLKPNERIIVNGCVLRNGPRRHVLEVENRADVLRGDDMLDEASARTPVRRLAYHLQIVLVSAQHRNLYEDLIASSFAALKEALPRKTAELDEAQGFVHAQNYYAAFRALSGLFAYEDALFAQLEGTQS